MALGLGPRAGPLAFIPILALIFTHGRAADQRTLTEAADPFGLDGRSAASLYFGWALCCARAVLQPRYRTLALAAALAGRWRRLLRSRARLLLTRHRAAGGGAPPLQDWIRRP